MFGNLKANILLESFFLPNAWHYCLLYIFQVGILYLLMYAVEVFSPSSCHKPRQRHWKVNDSNLVLAKCILPDRKIFKMRIYKVGSFFNYQNLTRQKTLWCASRCLFVSKQPSQLAGNSVSTVAGVTWLQSFPHCIYIMPESSFVTGLIFCEFKKQ